MLVAIVHWDVTSAHTDALSLALQEYGDSDVRLLTEGAHMSILLRAYGVDDADTPSLFNAPTKTKKTLTVISSDSISRYRGMLDTSPDYDGGSAGMSTKVYWHDRYLELYVSGSRVAEFQSAPKPDMPMLAGYSKYVSPPLPNRMETNSNPLAPAGYFKHAPPDKIELLEWIPPKWALLPTYSPGGRALVLDGSTLVTLAGKPGYGFEQTDPFSVAFWIKRPDTGNPASLIMSKQDAMLLQGIRILENANGMISLRMADDASGQIRVDSFHDITDGYWHWIVFTYDGSGGNGGLNVYVDGRNDSFRWGDTSLTGSVANDRPFAIGAGNMDTWLAPDTFLDDVMIYSEELTAEYISGVHECHKEKAAVLAAAEGVVQQHPYRLPHVCVGDDYRDALLAHLGFEGDLSDSSGNGNYGTARGDVRYA